MGRPLRVLQLIDSLARAGSEQSLASLAPYLVGEGIELHVAYLVERDGLRAVIERAGVPVHSLAGAASGRREWLDRTSDLISRLQPDIVHTTLFEADLAGRRAAVRTGVPCVSSLVNTRYGRTELDRGRVRRWRVRGAQFADAWTARRVARFHAVTQHVATVMGRRLGIPASKIEVIPRGRDPEALGRRSGPRRSATRERLGLADDVPLILAVGRQEPQKGFDVLLKALPSVQARFPDARVVVAGREGRASAMLAEIVQANGLSEMVTFLGVRDDVADLMTAADVLAFPSLWEGAAGTLLEAMALECPIVTSSLPTIRETADESVAEHVVPGEAVDLVRGLSAVLGDPRAAAERTRVGRTRFERHFTINVSASRMARLYSRVADSTA
jgi:glycosyltransferase involved in cell wall biosynthesis